MRPACWAPSTSSKTANEYIEDALVLAGRRTNLKRSALLTGAEIAFRRGEFRRALEMFDEIAKHGEPQEREAYRLEVGLAHTLAAQGDQKGGLAHLERAGELADPSDLAAAVEREKIRGLIYHFTHEFRSAVAAFERGVDLARASGLSYEVALALHNMGDALIWLGSFARSHVAFRESMSICEEYGYGRLAAHDRMYLAFLDAEKGHDDSANTLRRPHRRRRGQRLYLGRARRSSTCSARSHFVVATSTQHVRSLASCGTQHATITTNCSNEAPTKCSSNSTMVRAESDCAHTNEPSVRVVGHSDFRRDGQGQLGDSSLA